jgi:hypothetical protein
MKTLLTLSLFSVLLFFGCDRGTEIISPLSELPDQQLKVNSFHNSSEDSVDRNPYLHREDDSEYPPGADSVFLPTNLPPSGIAGFTVSKVIDGEIGGFIEIFYVYDDGNDDGDDDSGMEDLEVYARLDIPANAFNGSQEIWMIVDYEIATISFYPHMVFNTPANLDVTYSEFEVEDEDIDPDLIDFVFQAEDGSIEYLSYASLIVDVKEEFIALDDAQIHHFSRYGWIR